mmetsp:Transcript_21751/g.69462  ORF Transcript_21751/g.69462 Transcript_21751/m.69462 type:complete len:239 (-) Transcript_21751:49-765(-)
MLDWLFRLGSGVNVGENGLPILCPVLDLQIDACFQGTRVIRVHDLHVVVAKQRVVLLVIGDKAVAKKNFEGILAEHPCNDCHGGWERRRAHALALERTLAAFGHRKRRRTCKASRATREHELNVARHGVLRHAGLQPGLVLLRARTIDRHTGGVIVDTAQNQVNLARSIAPPRGEAVDEMWEVVHACHIVGVCLEFHIRVDGFERLASRVSLCQPTVLGPEEEAVHVRKLHVVVVEQD